jgi:hypothetical protein
VEWGIGSDDVTSTLKIRKKFTRSQVYKMYCILRYHKPPWVRVSKYIYKYEKKTKKGYLMDMHVIQTIVITAVSVFMIVQLLNNIVPKWKKYVGLTND